MLINHNLADDRTRVQCNYCAHSFEDLVWDSIHLGNKMYKHSPCPSCNKDIFIAIHNQIGSGHDNWDGKNSWHNHSNINFSKTNDKIRTLDRKVEILSTKIFSG